MGIYWERLFDVQYVSDSNLGMDKPIFININDRYMYHLLSRQPNDTLM